MSAKDHMDNVAGLPCVICWKRLGRKTYGVEVHHPTVPANDWLVVPLCVEHHRGATGVHGLHRKAFQTFWRASDYDLIAWTNELLARDAQ